jgi:uncharacterized protein
VSLAPSADQAIEATALWIELAVIGLNLCPFAARVVNARQLRYQVCESSDELAVLKAVAQELEWLAKADATVVDTSVLIAPNCLANFIDFNDFLGDAQAVLEDLGLEGEFQIASFHPHYQFEGTLADDIGNYTNRAPYPTLHFLREDSVSKAVDSVGDTDAIIVQNQETLAKLGLKGWQALFPKS